MTKDNSTGKGREFYSKGKEMFDNIEVIPTERKGKHMTKEVMQPEPLEYWNAVEGWVKIDEVREHFDSVGCGTIYKHGGEGRVPLYTAPPQQKAEPVAWDKPSASFNEWWDSDRHDGGNPFQTDSFAYWAWEGWQAALAQRPWVGLTDEEIEGAISDGFARGLDDGNVSNQAVIHYVRVIEAALRSKNHD